MAIFADFGFGTVIGFIMVFGGPILFVVFWTGRLLGLIRDPKDPAPPSPPPQTRSEAAPAPTWIVVAILVVGLFIFAALFSRPGPQIRPGSRPSDHEYLDWTPRDPR